MDWGETAPTGHSSAVVKLLSYAACHGMIPIAMRQFFWPGNETGYSDPESQVNPILEAGVEDLLPHLLPQQTMEQRHPRAIPNAEAMGEIDQTPKEELSDPVPAIRHRQGSNHRHNAIEAETARAGRKPAARAVGECLGIQASMAGKVPTAASARTTSLDLPSSMASKEPPPARGSGGSAVVALPDWPSGHSPDLPSSMASEESSSQRPSASPYFVGRKHKDAGGTTQATTDTEHRALTCGRPCDRPTVQYHVSHPQLFQRGPLVII